ncbi:UNVERIFIED_CONTAM: hypothetical protein Sradi_0736200 [Sesamum radiatum]|uniref:Transposase MuDR plant domain-containing protein n=1 Tax=Sesamum radiatum TaxID=300843 RepID=A0AAW2VSN5_SESRA
MIFENVDKFRNVLRDYVVQKGFVMIRLKNERTRVTYKCAADGCSWRIHVSPLSHEVTFAIKSLKDKHTCVRVKIVKEANSSWMSKRLLQVLRKNPNMEVRDMNYINMASIHLICSCTEPERKLLSRLVEAMGSHTPGTSLC